VSDIVNTVLGRSGADAAFGRVAPGYVLQIGGAIKTEDNASAKLVFADGSVVRVAADTSFTLKESTAANGSPLTTLQLELGKIFVYVAGGTMQVETPVGVASVRGSWAAFAFDPGDPNDPNDDKLIIECVEGECEGHNDQGQIQLGNFQGAALTHEGGGTVTVLTGAELREFFQTHQDLATALVATLTAAAPTTNAHAATSTPTATERASATPANTPTPTSTATSTAVPDRDGDGLSNADDRCPSESGPLSNNGCPLPPVCYALTIFNTGRGQAFASPPTCPDDSGRYEVGSEVVVAAYPDPDQLFVAWDGDAHGTANPTTIIMDGDKTVYAIFTTPQLPEPPEPPMEPPPA
jgi:hypothetical protein